MNSAPLLGGLHRPPPTSTPAPALFSAVAVVDDEVAAELGRYLRLWRVLPEAVTVDLEHLAPDIVLVSSMVDGPQREWARHLALQHGPIRRLLDRARELGIPAALWDLGGRWSSEAHPPGTLLSPIAVEGATTLPYAARGLANEKTSLRLSGRVGVVDADPAMHAELAARGIESVRLSPDAKPLGGVVVTLPRDDARPSDTSRSVVRAAAGRCAIVARATPAVSALLQTGDFVAVDGVGQAADAVARLLDDESARREIAQRAWRRVVSGHMWQDRAEFFHSMADAPQHSRGTSLTVVATVSDDPRPTLRAIREQRAIGEIVDRLRIELRWRGDHTPDNELPEALRTWGGLSVSAHDPSAPPTTDWVASMDDAHHYEPDYLYDLLLVTRCSVGDIVTKPASEGSDPWDRATNEVVPGAWIARPHVARSLLEEEASGASRLLLQAFAADGMSHVAPSLPAAPSDDCGSP